MCLCAVTQRAVVLRASRPRPVSAGWTFAVNEALLLFSSPPSLLSRSLSRPLSILKMKPVHCRVVQHSSALSGWWCRAGARLVSHPGHPRATGCSRGASCAAATCLQSLCLSDTFFLFSSFQSWRMMKTTSPTLGQKESFCTTTTAAKKNVSAAAQRSVSITDRGSDQIWCVASHLDFSLCFSSLFIACSVSVLESEGSQRHRL